MEQHEGEEGRIWTHNPDENGKMDNKQSDLVCGDLPRITDVSSCRRLDATRLQQFSGLGSCEGLSCSSRGPLVVGKNRRSTILIHGIEKQLADEKLKKKSTEAAETHEETNLSRFKKNLGQEKPFLIAYCNKN